MLWVDEREVIMEDIVFPWLDGSLVVISMKSCLFEVISLLWVDEREVIMEDIVFPCLDGSPVVIRSKLLK